MTLLDFFVLLNGTAFGGTGGRKNLVFTVTFFQVWLGEFSLATRYRYAQLN